LWKKTVRGLVAQLVEQSPEKACVGGSNPPQTTNLPI
jgi:hypothetical protein